jgi:phospholipid transport system substrate-binding protein
MKSIFFSVFLALLLGLSRPIFADSDPAAPIHLLCDRLIEVMKQGHELGFRGRESKLRPVIGNVYDMSLVTKNTLGLAANKLTPEEVSQLADAYGRFSSATYADQFNSWGGERFEIEAARPAANGLMLVPSFIVGSDGSRTGIDYLVHESNGSWKIVDVLFEGSVSQVAVRRSEFVPIFRQNGVAALIAMLDTKSQALEKK